MNEPSSLSAVKVMLDDDNEESEVEAEEIPKFVFKANQEAKLKELLHNINALEIKICSDATKEFIKLLKGDSGGELLLLYVHTSNRFSELIEAWQLRQGKPGMPYIFSLISAILSHPDGMYALNDKDRIAISRVIDKFARTIIDEKMDDIYKELNSKEGKRQNAALLLMASIVTRGSGLASEVAKKFDFKLQVFSKLAEYKRRGSDMKRKHMTRKSFVRFAMAFLEVGKPGLLRWILQQKEMYSGVLRGLGNDEDKIVVYVLSTLQNKVMTEDSLVPPGLRSVLFGSVTLEQLVRISGRENGGPAAGFAHSVLVTVCTDPCNGLMPDLKRQPNPLRGNPKRLLGLMKKLKATEISYHRDILLAILQGRPSLASAYMNEFPYNLEDFASPNWFASVSLAANLLTSVGMGLCFDFLDTSQDSPSMDNPDVQSILSCICPRPFSRSVINKGLLHSDFLVKHGTLRLLLEALKLLDSFISALHRSSCSSNQIMQSWAYLIQEIQNEVRTLLPDPQVLLTLLSAQSSQSRVCESCLKRKAGSAYVLECKSKSRKKLKTTVVNEDTDTDIIISGMNVDSQFTLPKDSENFSDTLIVDSVDTEKELMNTILEIWGLDLCSKPDVALNDADIYFHSKILDTLKFYLRMTPTVLEGSFDFFMNLLNDPLALPTNLQCSILSLLIEYVDWSTRSGIPVRMPPLMYKHLQPFVNLFIFSPISEIKHQAYNLAQAAMLSTGAFDRNINEIGAWFVFLPGYNRNKWCIEEQGLAVLQSLSRVVISFLCDAISTVGNNLFKCWATVEHHTHLNGFKDLSPDFSPLIICVQQKCLRLLNSESGTFSLLEKSMISLYVSNTLKYLLQTQVDARSLAALIQSILSEGLKGRYSLDDDSGDYLCEWRPLKSLFLFSHGISSRQACCMFLIDKKAVPTVGSFANTLGEVKKIISSENTVEIAGITKAFSSAVLCTTPDELLRSFPLVMTISHNLLRVPAALLSSMIFLEQSFLASVSKLWPEMFFSGLEIAVSMIHHEVREFDVSRIPTHSLFNEEAPRNIDFDAIESAAGALSFFLKQAPFHVLFPAIMTVEAPFLSEPSKLQDLLLDKLSDWRSDCLISYLRLVLFWFFQIQSSYKDKPVAELLQLSEICIVLVKNVFTQLLVLKPNPGCPTTVGFHLLAENVWEVAETVLCHPAVLALSSPLSCDLKLPVGNLGHNLETFLSLSQQSVHKIDHHVLNMLTATLDHLFSSGTDQYTILEFDGGVCRSLVKAFNTFVQRLFLELRDKFDLCIATEDVLPLLPAFYALHALIRFISPFKLLELVHWMLRKVDVNEMSICKSCNVYALSVGFCIAGGTFEALSNYLQQPVEKRASYNLLWETDENSFVVSHIEEIYIDVCKLAINFDLGLADICLLKVVNCIYGKNYVQSVHPLNLVMSRVIVKTPIEMISHCVYRTSMTKAKVLFLFTKMSPMHLSVFGNLLVGSLNKDSLFTGCQMSSCGYALSDEEYVMLLPAALSYLDMNFWKFGKQYHKQLIDIPSFYSRMLLSGFHNWKSFVSGYIFQEEYDGFFPSSTEKVLNLVNGSLLGKTVLLLRYHFALNGDSVKTKKLLKLFNSIFPCSGAQNELLDCDINEVKSNSFKQSLNLINRVVAKVSLCRMLLFPEDDQVQFLPNVADQGLKEISLESGSDEQNSSRMRFMNILVGSWQWMVMKLPSVSNDFERNKSTDVLSLYKYLEVFILRSIFELVSKMRKGLIELQSIPFLEQLIRSALFYRFKCSTTLKMLQSILALLLEGKFSCGLYLQLLLAHSQFATTIQSVSASSNAVSGVLLRPMSSILGFLVIHHFNQNADGKNDKKTTELYQSQLEVVKLLRTILQFKAHPCGSDFRKDSDFNLRELYLLLLASYGATLSYIDVEIYDVMHAIELIENSDNEIAQLDYLWGSAAVKVRKERILEQDTSCNITTDTQAAKEQKRSQFRENLAFDPKICAMTVLYFPYDRTAGDEPSSSHKLKADDLWNTDKIHSPDLEDLQRYDPVFILRFAMHSLSVGFIEPVEFAGLGLLAVAFVSISSPHVGMRKLGYESLERFKNELEKCSKKKDVMRLRLLLTYVQNGIEEPWQRIPSVIAVFAAEASLLLLDPLHDHYTSLSKLLMRSSRVNLKSIPLFHDFFSSSSVNFRKERLWMLRLLYAGLNLDDDAQIYIRNSVLEILMSFYASPLSDNESKELILLILQKSIKLHKMACYLVEHCGLFSWLSSLLSSFSEMLLGGEIRFLMARLVLVVEVVNDVISSRNINEWLQRHALEQLVDFSSHLYKLLVGGMKLMRENVPLVNSILLILISTMKISQKRKMYKPHFTLSLESFFQICQAVEMCNTARSGAHAELALKVILMSTPPVDIFHVNQGKLSSFLTWAISTALKSDSGQMYELRESHLHLRNMLEDAPFEESLTSKLLRWFVASVILGKLSGKLHIPSSKLSKRSYETLNSLFQDFGNECVENDKTRFDCIEILAAAIFYLQQHLGLCYGGLPSVISALSILLLSDVSEYAGSAFKLGYRTSLASLWSRIHCPAEANPSWRWSFYQPWKDLSLELTDLQKIDELHACQTLLVIISNVLGKKSLDSQVLSYQDDKISGVFLWERSIIETE